MVPLSINSLNALSLKSVLSSEFKDLRFSMRDKTHREKIRGVLLSGLKVRSVWVWALINPGTITVLKPEEPFEFFFFSILFLSTI